MLVDFDGTITDADTLDVLVRASGQNGAWEAIEQGLRAGALPLRAALERQAALVRFSLAEALAVLAREISADPTFPAFVAAARAAGMRVAVVSSGLAPVVRARLAALGLHDLEVVANEVDAAPEGWRIRFRDLAPNGTDKVAIVECEQRAGRAVFYVGDGFSDYDAALAADRVAAKRGRKLEQHLRRLGLPFVAFERFAELEPLPASLARELLPTSLRSPRRAFPAGR
ncbi:MAG: HAD-IB family phosphatase [Vulcanimicrobiaceae bacterium]